jgi:hypothetical protein
MAWLLFYEDRAAEFTGDFHYFVERMLRDPYWPFPAAEELGQRDRLPLPAAYDYVPRQPHA